MTNVTRIATSFTLLLAVFVGGAHVVVASEVTGSLSSDGSSSYTTTHAQQSSAAPTNGTQGNSGALTGSVVGGKDSNDSGMTALVASAHYTADAVSNMWWLILLALIALTGAGYYFYISRRNRPVR